MNVKSLVVHIDGYGFQKLTVMCSYSLFCLFSSHCIQTKHISQVCNGRGILLMLLHFDYMYVRALCYNCFDCILD